MAFILNFSQLRSRAQCLVGQAGYLYAFGKHSILLEHANKIPPNNFFKNYYISTQRVRYFVFGDSLWRFFKIKKEKRGSSGKEKGYEGWVGIWTQCDQRMNPSLSQRWRTIGWKRLIGEVNRSLLTGLSRSGPPGSWLKDAYWTNLIPMNPHSPA